MFLLQLWEIELGKVMIFKKLFNTLGLKKIKVSSLIHIVKVLFCKN